MSIERKIIGIIDRIDRFIMGIASVGFIVLFFVLLVQITGRHVLVRPFVGTEDIARTMYIWISFIAMGPLIRSKEHILVDMFTSYLSNYWKKWIELLSDLLCLVFAIFFLMSAVKMTTFSWRLPLPSVPEITTGHQYLAISIAGILSVFFLVECIIKKFFFNNNIENKRYLNK